VYCIGIFFAAYNLFAIGAIPRLGYGIAFPLSQCSVLVGGLWGIYYFNEIKGTFCYLIINDSCFTIFHVMFMLLLFINIESFVILNLL
jgi:glucose uptake protein GlcU